jgi:hypothetical protein
MACRHIKPNGERCKSPSLRGHAFCYFHAKLHSATRIRVMDDVRLPLPEDATSVQLSIARISEALLSSRIDTKHAAQLLWGLQLALQSLNRPAPVWEDIEPVRSITRTKDGDDLAPIQEICEPDDDCNECEWADTCDDYHGDPRDNEDDEVGDGEESPEDEDCDEEEIGKEASDADSGSADDGQRKECLGQRLGLTYSGKQLWSDSISSTESPMTVS